MTNRADRNKQNIASPPNVIGSDGGLPGRHHSRIDAKQVNDLENNALSTNGPHATYKVQGATRSKKGRYRTKTHRLIKGAEERKIRTGRRNHFVGDVPMTRLNGKLVSGESLLEIDALTVLDFDGGFADVVAQPFTTTITVGLKERRWTPDFLIRQNDRPNDVIEVKMLSWLYHKDPAKATLARKRLEAMRVACSKLGHNFSLWTEDEIRVEPRLYNAKMAQRHCGPLVPESSIVLGLSALVATPDSIAIRKFADLIAPLHPIHGLGLAIKLERLGHVRIDRRQKYSFSSIMTKIATIGRKT